MNTRRGLNYYDPIFQISPRQNHTCQAHQDTLVKLISTLSSEWWWWHSPFALPHPALPLSHLFQLRVDYGLCTKLLLLLDLPLWDYFDLVLAFILCYLRALYFSHLVLLIRLEYFSSIVTFHCLGWSLQRTASINQGRLRDDSQIVTASHGGGIYLNV